MTIIYEKWYQHQKKTLNLTNYLYNKEKPEKKCIYYTFLGNNINHYSSTFLTDKE